MVTYQTTFKGYLRNLLSFFDFFTQSYNYGFYGLSWRRGWEEYDRYFSTIFLWFDVLKKYSSGGCCDAMCQVLEMLVSRAVGNQTINSVFLEQI